PAATSGPDSELIGSPTKAEAPRPASAPVRPATPPSSGGNVPPPAQNVDQDVISRLMGDSEKPR
ncbi:MAG: hypothetical protein ACK58T_29555, partial [Phycisphaerae bacterium]